MFMRELLGRYGAGTIAQPAYLPEGAVPETMEATN